MTHILVIDVGGTNVKVGTVRRKPLKIPSGKRMTAAEVPNTIERWKYGAVSIGYPADVRAASPPTEPHSLGGGWMYFDYENAL